jgi:hypothetical protein
MSKHPMSWLRPLVIVALAAATGTAAQAAKFVTEVVESPPPAPVTETVTVAPHPGWLWHPGYYRWEENKYVWTAGEWTEPRPGYRWEPHAWVKEGKGWRLREGEWVKVKE